MIAYALSFVAGTLTVLSPCVLPALPIVVGSAARTHRHGPLLLAAGMVLSFTAFGLFFAGFGLSLGLDRNALRSFSAAMLVVFGLSLCLSLLHQKIGLLFAPISRWADLRARRGERNDDYGPLILGALLGGIWSPCIGPTMGAALGLATQAGGLRQAAFMMFLFGAGSALPLAILAYGSKALVLAHRRRLSKMHRWATPALGAVLAVIGATVLLGGDKAVEAALLPLLPEVWLDLITVL